MSNSSTPIDPQTLLDTSPEYTATIPEIVVNGGEGPQQPQAAPLYIPQQELKIKEL